MEKVKYLLLYWLWQFPQKLLGTILAKALKAERHSLPTHGGMIEWRCFKRSTAFSTFISGVSLADAILLSNNNGSEETVRHEHGHSIQSLRLGWLYLPIVGAYSAVFCNLWDRWFHRGWHRYDRQYWYYVTRWTERWADRLGKVDRGKALASIPRPANAQYPAMPSQREEKN